MKFDPLNPWMRPDGKYYIASCVQDRLDALKTMNIDHLKAIIAWDGTQITVRKRAQSLLIKLCRRGVTNG